MLIHPGDLIPVQEEAIQIPWTKRKSSILNYLHKGPVNFQTFVYDTNVGDISTLSTYFNPDRWTVSDLNDKFAQRPESEATFVKAVAEGGNNNSTDGAGKSLDPNPGPPSSSVLPRLLLCPQEDVSLSEKAKATMQWVISQRTLKLLNNSPPSPLLPPSSPEEDVFLPWENALALKSDQKQTAVTNSNSAGKFSSQSPALLNSNNSLSALSNTARRASVEDTWPLSGGLLDSWPSRSILCSSGSSLLRSPEPPASGREDFLLGESLLAKLSSSELFQRNETLV